MGLPPLRKNPTVEEVFQKMRELKQKHKEQCYVYLDKISTLEQEV